MSDEISEPWRSRIIGSGTEQTDQLLANPLNWRIHPRHQQQALEAVLNDIGWVQQIIVNQRTGHVIDGHLRIALALRRNEPAVPVLYVDLTENEERVIIATLDPIAALAVADKDQFAALVSQIEATSDEVDGLLQSITQDTFGRETISTAKIEPCVCPTCGAKHYKADGG